MNSRILISTFLFVGLGCFSTVNAEDGLERRIEKLTHQIRQLRKEVALLGAERTRDIEDESHAEEPDLSPIELRGFQRRIDLAIAESKRGPSWEPSEEDSTAEQLGSGIGNARRDSTASGLKSVLRDTYRVEVNGVSFYILALDQIERIAKTREDSAQGGHRTN